jgi:hypothetical protein
LAFPQQLHSILFLTKSYLACQKASCIKLVRIRKPDTEWSDVLDTTFPSSNAALKNIKKFLVWFLRHGCLIYIFHPPSTNTDSLTFFQEHVIVQLQEETDTVGEYITIYQYQRQQQRRRLEENERQLQIVSRDKEDLKTKLSQLQLLVTSFVQDAPSTTTASRVTGPNKSSLNGPINQNGKYIIYF